MVFVYSRDVCVVLDEYIGSDLIESSFFGKLLNCSPCQEVSVYLLVVLARVRRLEIACAWVLESLVRILLVEQSHDFYVLRYGIGLGSCVNLLRI